MDIGFWLSIILGLGVAGHAVVGIILTTPLSRPTEVLWSRFGAHGRLLRLNGLLLVIASALHLVVSGVKAIGTEPAVFASSIAAFPFFIVAGLMERRAAIGWTHHVVMAVGWLSFGWHATVAG